MKAPHPVFLAATRLDGLGQALLAGQPVAVSGLALSETAAVMYAAATEIRELRAQVAALAQADAGGAAVNTFPSNVAQDTDEIARSRVGLL